MTMIKIVSLFSGIGGFEKGFQQASDMIETVFASETDKYARQIYKKNFGVEPHGDITQIDAADIPDHDILCGGFPCQAFSIAGKRRGFEDTRGTLFFEIMRIAKVKRSKLLFLENVKGLLSHDEGRTFQTILRSMDDVGYDAEWQVFNSKNHGVPQNRERVFLIGHLRGSGTRQIFPITESKSAVSQKGDGKHIYAGCISTSNQSGQAQWDGSTTLICDCGQGRKDQLRSEIVPPLRANTGAGHNNLVVPVLTPERVNKRQAGRRFKEDGDPSFTVTSQDRHGVLLNNKIRRLTPVECERLQGFPDGWTEGISDTQRYKCLGNAVTVNVVEFIAKHIIERSMEDTPPLTSYFREE